MDYNKNRSRINILKEIRMYKNYKEMAEKRNEYNIVEYYSKILTKLYQKLKEISSK